jgi:hypothetical protein
MKGTMKIRKSLVISWTLGLVVLFPNLTACSRHYDVVKVDAGQGRSLVISTDSYYENEQPIYYEVVAAGRVVVPRTYISSEEPEYIANLRLRLVTNKDRSLIGVVEERLPQKVWLLHNFSTGETWPRCQSGTMEQCEQRGEALRRVLQKDHPEVVFVL